MSLSDRRRFLRDVCVAATSLTSLNFMSSGCDVDLGSRETVLDRLLKHEDRVSYEVRYVGGQRRVYVTEIRGFREDPTQDLFWIFTVDGVVSSQAADVCLVSPHQEVRWQRMRSREL